MTENERATVQGPAWDLADEYPALDSPGLAQDLAALDEQLGRMAEEGTALRGVSIEDLSADGAEREIAAARRLFEVSEQARRVLGNLSVFAGCLLSVDADDAGAQALQGRLQAYHKRIAELGEPLAQFLRRADDRVIERYLEDPLVAPSAFQVQHARERRHEQLSLAEENLISGLAQDGIHAWGRLYTQLSGTLRCAVRRGEETRTMGLAQASGLMQQPDEEVRRAAWAGINTAWEAHQETCAAALNAIAGWRLELTARRSHTRAVHYLDAPVHMNRISRATLQTLLDVCERTAPLARRTATAMARAGGREQLGPWDLRAPAPRFSGEAKPIAFDDAVELIAGAYGSVAPEMGEFVRMMAARRWIEGTVTERKRPGAYCTGFPKSRHPRVYMTYSGSNSDIVTLAHELGHAFHGWSMRDLPDSQRSYGMSLAETASTFGETTVRDALLQRAPDAAAQFDILWEEVAALPTFLLNIPARFDFENRFYERRAERPLRPQEIGDLMAGAWERWYAQAMSEPDRWFWASKLHFYISGLSFYNFPYLFGYLFSMGVYLRREAHGADFYPRYVALLRDTGRMRAEDLAREHLGVALEEPGFWEDTLARLEPRVTRFEELVAELA